MQIPDSWFHFRQLFWNSPWALLLFVGILSIFESNKCAVYIIWLWRGQSGQFGSRQVALNTFGGSSLERHRPSFIYAKFPHWATFRIFGLTRWKNNWINAANRYVWEIRSKTRHVNIFFCKVSRKVYIKTLFLLFAL